MTTRDESYAVVKHWETDHFQQAQPKFTFEVVRSFRSSLERQIFEAITIDEAPPEVRLNSKAEWGCNRIPRLVIDPESQRPGQEQQGGQDPPDDQPASQANNQVKDAQVKEQRENTRSSQKRSNSNPDLITGNNAQQSSKRPKLNILDHFKSSR